MDRLSALDAWFLDVEDDANQMAIGSVAVFEGPAPDQQELLTTTAACLDAIPRYRQRLQRVPFSVGRPVWVDDPHFDVSYHVRRTALPSPGGEAELRTLVGRVMAQRLDRRRPLWESWVVEGLEDGAWAWLSKVHHALVDGVGGTDLLALLLDDAPDAPRPEPAAWHPEPGPSPVRLVSSAARGHATAPLRAAASLAGAATHPAATGRRAWRTARGAARLAGVLRPTPATCLNGPLGPHRAWALARTTLDDVKQVRTHLGGTVNDVVLAAVAGGLRALLLAHGEEPTPRCVRTMIPVSLREPDQRGAMHNHVAAVFVDLPVDVADPVERLAVVRERVADVKTSGELEAATGLVWAADHLPGTVMHLGTRELLWGVQHVGQRFISTVATNVPGPQQPWYLAGRRMLEIFPYVPVGEAVRVTVGILSYDGQLTFGVTGDAGSVPDLDVLARGIEDALTRLRKAVG